METDGNQAEPKLKTLITQYSEVFEEGLEPKAKIHVKENAVPYAMKAKIEEELKRLQEEGTIEPCLLYTSPSPRDLSTSRMPSSA